MGDEIVIREATLEDGPTLAEIERNSPLVFGGNQLVIDRGGDYWAAARLMGDYIAVVAEVDGEAAGVFGSALHPARIGGRDYRVLYVNHARILPQFQDRGLGKKLAEGLRKAFEGRYDSMYWYITPENAHSQAFTRRSPNHWSIRPAMLSLETDKKAGPPAGRAATPGDATMLANVFNASHAGEEMFVPYTPESLRARLSRAPLQYSWGDIRILGGAALGAWPEGDYFRIRLTAEDGSVTESRGAAVVDFGCLPGCDGDLLALLGAACADFADRGMAELSVFSCPGTLLWPVLSPLAEPSYFDFWTPEIAEPAGVAARGLYVDHVYF